MTDLSINTRIRAREIPGMRSILVGFYTTAVSICVPTLATFGFSLPYREISIVTMSLGFLFVMQGSIRHFRLQRHSLGFRSPHLNKIKLWLGSITFFSAIGLILGNETSLVFREYFTLLYFACFLYLGGDDKVYAVTIRHLVILFYSGGVLSLLYFNVPAVELNYEGFSYDQAGNLNERFTNSHAYSFRPLISTGIFLSLVGMVARKKKGKSFFLIMTLVLYFLINVVIFKFRSAAVFSVFAVLSFVFFRPILEKKFKLSTSIFIVAMTFAFAAYYSQTESWQMLDSRFRGNSGAVVTEDLLTSRTDEFKAYLEDMGFKILVGRGLGGTFDAIDVYRYRENADHWRTLHYGIMIFTLKGGVFLLLLFCGFIVPFFLPRSSIWYKNKINLSSGVFFPILLFSIIFNPISLSPVSLYWFAILGLTLSRYGLKQISQNNLHGD